METGDMDRTTRHTGLKVAVGLGILMVALGGIAVAGAGKWQGAMFDRIDANSDNQVSLDEFQPFAKKRFKHFDTDGDGVVSAAEIDAHLMKRMEKRRQRLLKRFDDDGDGAVTSAEFDKQVMTMFNRVDGDDNATVSRDEAAKMRQHMRARWKRHMGHDHEDAAPGQSQEN